MKTFIAAIFLLAFTTLTFSNAVIYISFYANQKNIAENFCINKARPAMNCCGKCQLTKKIKSEENKNRQNPNRKNENRVEIFPLLSVMPLQNINDAAFIIKTYPPFSPRLPLEILSRIFRPPSA